MKTIQQVQNELRNEVGETLFFFCQMDMKMYGHITTGTLEAFAMQKVKFPQQFKSLLQP